MKKPLEVGRSLGGLCRRIGGIGLPLHGIKL